MQVWSLFLLPNYPDLDKTITRLHVRDYYPALKTVEGKVKPSLPGKSL